MRSRLIRLVGVACMWVLFLVVLPAATFFAAYPLARTLGLDLARRDLHWLLCMVAAALANLRLLRWLRSLTLAWPAGTALATMFAVFGKLVPFFALAIVAVIIYGGLGELIRRPQGQARIVFEMVRIGVGFLLAGAPIALGQWLIPHTMVYGQGVGPPRMGGRGGLLTWLLRRR